MCSSSSSVVIYICHVKWLSLLGSLSLKTQVTTTVVALATILLYNSILQEHHTGLISKSKR